MERVSGRLSAVATREGEPRGIGDHPRPCRPGEGWIERIGHPDASSRPGESCAGAGRELGRELDALELLRLDRRSEFCAKGEEQLALSTGGIEEVS